MSGEMQMWRKSFQNTFATYLDIDASEKPPHENFKTFLLHLRGFLVGVSITFFFLNCDFMVLGGMETQLVSELGARAAKVKN